MERILEEVPYHVFSYQGDSFVAHRGLKRPLKISQEAKSHLERRAAGEQASPENEGLRREISALEESGFFEPCEQPIPTDAEFDRLLRLRYEAPWTKLELALSEVCNLACRYCYCGTCRDEVPNQGRMSETIARAAINWLFAVSGRSKEVGITFFGGEPLMNKKALLFAVAYSQRLAKLHGKKVFYSMTTNGTLIDDDVIDFANREMSNVVLSLDGRKEIHDRLRVDYAGNGSYERIVPKFQKLVEARGNKNYYMRGTFTHANPDFTKDLFHMADLGFTELSMEPVVCAPEDPAALTAEDLEIVKDQYELLAKDMLRREKEGKPITFYHYMLDLTGGPCIYKRISGCGSGTEYMAVTPWGDLYPCHQFVGEEAYKLGDIWNGVTNTALREEFRSCNAYARPECNDCWARFYCSGGCAANAFHATGSIRGVYEAGCELFRKRIECAIMMKVAEDSAKANG